MTKDIKNYSAANASLAKLETQLAAESKTDPRLKRGHKRIKRMMELLAVAQTKYEIIHNRRVPAKVNERKAGDAAKPAKKTAAKKTPAKKVKKADNVVALHPAKKAAAATARARGSVKRSAKKR